MYILISVLMLAFRDGAVGEEGGGEGRVSCVTSLKL